MSFVRNRNNKRQRTGRGPRKPKSNRDKEERQLSIRNEEGYFSKATKLGSSNEFVDFETLIQPYLWTTVTPVIESATRTHASARMPTLKRLCAEQLARNVEYIGWHLIASAPWSIWKLVWTIIVKTGQDSPETYAKFAKFFHSFQDFRAHRYLLEQGIRGQAIGKYLIPGCRLHRVETVFRNIDLHDTIKFLDIWQPITILDLSLIKLSRDEYFALFNIPNLVCLSLCNHHIDDTFIASLCSTIKNGKLWKLSVLKIENTKVTKTGIMSLFALGKESCDLSCIETDIPIVDNYACSTNWLKLDNESALIYRLPLALKLNALMKKNILQTSIINDNIMDLMVVDKTWHSSNASQENINLAWEARKDATIKRYRGKTYIRKHELQKVDGPNGIDAVSSTENTLLPTEQRRKKHKNRIQLNAKNFFCI